MNNDVTLAVKYRPNSWESIVGADTTVEILKQQVETDTTVGSYLFTGQSGGGKTTTARVFAVAINKGKGHPIEIDAASNNSVENVRNIIAQSKQRSLDSEYKVYIIDEAHSLSAQAWEAFLKVIEEPPKYTKFIFCTTNPEKIPNTILTRVQTFNFIKIPDSLIAERLAYICDTEKNLYKDSIQPEDYTYDKDALLYIARTAEGSLRQAITYLEKAISYNKQITMDNVCSALGTGNYDIMTEFLIGIITKDSAKALHSLEGVYNSGKDMKVFIYDCLLYLLALNKVNIDSTLVAFTQLPKSTAVDNIKTYASSFMGLMKSFSKLYESIKYDSNPASMVEITVLQWCAR